MKKKLFNLGFCFILLFSSLSCSRVSAKEELYIGVDIGGQSIKMGVVSENGEIKEERKIRMDNQKSPQEVIAEITREIRGFKDYERIRAVGIGMPGDINAKKGVVRFSPNLLKWKEVPLKGLIEQELKGKKTYVDNDANVAALGAYYADIKQKSENMVCVTLGTGIGGGIIINKKLYTGSSGSAGEVGHITIDEKGPNCQCGSNGCIEAYIGEKYFMKYIENYMKRTGKRFIKNGEELNCKTLYEKAQKGDKTAKEMWRFYGKKLGIGLATIINILNPDSIVICGGVSPASEYFMDTVQKEIQKRTYTSAAETCKITISQNTSELGLIGAAMLAKEGK
jgi:glucokinase